MTDKKDKKENKESKNNPKIVLENKLPRYIIGAFSIVTAMAWNEYVQDQMNNKVKNKTRAKFLYAITATIILIVAVFVIHKCVDWYLTIKEKTDNIVNEIVCHKQAVANIKDIGPIYIKRIGTNRLIWTFDQLKLLNNARYDILINSCEPVRLTMFTNNQGKLPNMITYDWELNQLMGRYLDFKDYAQGPVYTGIISVNRN